MIDDKNIFERGMLIHLQMGAYKGRMKLSEEQLKDLPKEIVRGVHDLFEKEFKDILDEIGSHDNGSRILMRRNSVPFPIDGVWFIPSISINSIIDSLETRKAERAELISKAVANYEAAIAKFASAYPEYYQHAKSKYPTKKEFASRFYFRYQFIRINAPDKNSQFITPEMYKVEMKKFKETIGDMKQEVLGIIGSTLLEMTARLKSQCADGKPNQRTFNNLNEFLERIDNVYSDFIDRDDLKKTIKKIKAQVLGVDAESLRDSEDFKKKFGKEIGALAKEINALPDIPLKRAIDF